MFGFGKKSILDLTEKKTFGKKRSIVPSGDISNYKDLSNSNSETESAFGFLGSMASSSAGSNNDFSGSENLETKHLKVKIEDIEYKLDSLSKKISALMDRLDLAERKIDSVYRR